MTTSSNGSAITSASSGSGPTRRRRGTRGEGTQRERRPGVWELRVPTSPDPATGAQVQISVTVHGSATEAAAERAHLVAWHRERPQLHRPGATWPLPPPSRVTLADLLEMWLAADHPWKPSTYTGYRSNTRALLVDPVASLRAQTLTPQQVRHRLRAWEDAGAGLAVRGGRFRALRACLSWAYDERLIDTHPLRLMRGPGRCEPRRPLARAEVHALLIAAEVRLLEAHANTPAALFETAPASVNHAALQRLHRAEQDLLLVRLAADTGARRGELTALKSTDLGGCEGRTLRIERSLSAGQLTTPKSGHGRAITVGADTAALWHRLHTTWTDRHLDTAGVTDGRPGTTVSAGLGPWIFTADLAHHHRLGAEVLGHRFERLRDAAGVPDATLHRLRHSVATYLVSNGQILQAQARLGHADAATTLREYSHALPATDTNTADAINNYLDLTRAVTESPAAQPNRPNTELPPLP